MNGDAWPALSPPPPRPTLAGDDTAALRHDVAAAAASSGLIDVRLVDADGRTLAYFAAPGRASGKAGPAHTGRPRSIIVTAGPWAQVVLRAHEPTHLDLLPRFLALTGALFFGASGIALFVAQSLSRRVSAPIERLSKAMAAGRRPAASSGRCDPQSPTTTSSMRLTDELQRPAHPDRRQPPGAAARRSRT